MSDPQTTKADLAEWQRKVYQNVKDGSAPEKMCECGKKTEARCHNPPSWQFTEFGCLWACRPVSER